jgi:predicted TIM-barrel fold metal-dependent hydrolase
MRRRTTAKPLSSKYVQRASINLKGLGSRITIALGATLMCCFSFAQNVTPGGYVDIHVHTAGIGKQGSGAFVSKQMREGFKFGLYLRAFDVTLEELETRGDKIVVERIAKNIAQSARVSQAVVLALDGVTNKAGNLDREATQIYVPNDFVAAQTARFPQLLFGASINPTRHDALARLDKAKAQGAVLVKWIPAIMGFNPSNDSLKPFYARMKTHGLALLSHAGQERAFGPADDSLGDPRHLELALKAGVTVIVGHLATTGKTEGKDYFYHLLPMFERYPNLYAEISSLTQINKRGYLYEALEDKNLHARLLYGSDWPLQFFPLVSPWYQFPTVSISTISAVRALDNLWDRDVALKEAMGVPAHIFERTGKLLGVTR